MELNDIYDENRNLTGKLHRRGTPWKPGEYGVVVCVWVYDLSLIHIWVWGSTPFAPSMTMTAESAAMRVR